MDNINGIVNLAANVSVQNTKSASDTSEAAVSFQSMLLSQTSIVDNNSLKLSSNTDTNSLSAVDESTGVNNYDRYEASAFSNDNSKIKDADTSVSQSSVDKGMTKEMAETVSDEIVETVADDLNLTEDQVLEAMEELGLSAFDLLDVQNLIKLCGTLMDAEGSEDIIVSSDFGTLLMDMNNIRDSLLEELDLGLDSLGQIIDKANELMTQVSEFEQMLSSEPEDFLKNPSLENTNGELTDEVSELADESQMTEAVTGGQENETLGQNVIEVEDNSVAKEGQTDNDPEQNTYEVDEETEVVNMEETNQSGGSSSDTSSDEMDDDSLMDERINQLNKNEASKNADKTFVTYESVQTVTTETVTVQTQTISYSSIDVMDLINQVSEMTRVLIQTDSTTMEMQLNPENLGKLFLSISSKQGTISAQFEAENLAVKEALETQMATLRENLNQAGLKVEAIEVTVKSHEFEQNLDGNNANDQNENANETNKTARRNLNMNSLDELTGLMSEEEMLAAKIMKDNGNSVDLTA